MIVTLTYNKIMLNTKYTAGGKSIIQPFGFSGVRVLIIRLAKCLVKKSVLTFSCSFDSLQSAPARKKGSEQHKVNSVLMQTMCDDYMLPALHALNNPV